MSIADAEFGFLRVFITCFEHGKGLSHKVVWMKVHTYSPALGTERLASRRLLEIIPNAWSTAPEICRKRTREKRAEQVFPPRTRLPMSLLPPIPSPDSLKLLGRKATPACIHRWHFSKIALHLLLYRSPSLPISLDISAPSTFLPLVPVLLAMGPEGPGRPTTEQH